MRGEGANEGERLKVEKISKGRGFCLYDGDLLRRPLPSPSLNGPPQFSPGEVL